MQYPSKSSNGVSLVPLESKLLLSNTIFLEGEITQEMACDFAKQVILLSRENNTKSIRLIINSNGGEINAGLLIYDIIQNCPVPIETYCFGKAYSMAAVLFMCGTGGRYMFKNSELMLHEPLIESSIRGSSSSIHSMSETLKKTQKFMVGIISKHSNLTEEQTNEIIGYDHYFSYEECLENGFCDGLIDFNQLIKEV